MPRPNKTGLDYFPLDCQLDSAMELVEAEHGAVGFMVMIKLWQMIYREEGYYCKWEEVNQKAFARRNGLTVDEVSAVVISAITHHLFDNNLAERGILTSTGIQKRFANMTSKRKVIDVYSDLLLIPVDKLGSKNRDYTTIINEQFYFAKGIKKKVSAKVISEITPDNSGNNGESKQKVNMESKVKNILGDSDESPKKQLFKKPSLDDVTAYCRERGNTVDPSRWINHYESKGWKIGKNPMKDWQAAVRTWEPEGFKPKKPDAKPKEPKQYVPCPYCGEQPNAQVIESGITWCGCAKWDFSTGADYK